MANPLLELYKRAKNKVKAELRENLGVGEAGMGDLGRATGRLFKNPITEISRQSKAAKGGIDVAQDYSQRMARVVPRAGMQVGLTATEPVLKVKKFYPTTKFERLIYGDEPIDRVQDRIQANYDRQREVGIPEGVAKLTAAPLALAGLATDFNPISGAKKGLTRQLTKEMTEEGVRKALGNQARNYSDEVIKQIAKTTDEKVVQTFLNNPLPSQAVKPGNKLNTAITKVVDAKAGEIQGKANFRQQIADIIGEDTIKNVKNFVNSKAFQNGKKDVSNMEGFDEVTQALRDNLSRPDMTDNEALDLILSLPSKRQVALPKVETSGTKPPKEPFTPLFAGDVPPPTKGRGGLQAPELDFGKFKDKQAFVLARETLERNIESVAGEQAPKLKQFIIEPLRANETQRVGFLNTMRQTINEDVVKGLGIRAGSQEDKLIQRFGEGRITLDELKATTPKWQQVSEAASYFRQVYDDLLEQINGVRTQSGYTPIPKRSDYFRHFQEIGNAIDQIGLILRQEDLPTGISGISDIFKPGKPFTTAELQRKGGAFTESAIRGMDNYLDAVSKQIYHLDTVQRARVIEDYIRQQSAYAPVQLPNFVANVSEFANLVAGKKAKLDRAGESIFGRQIYGILNVLQKRTGANMIAGNVSSALTNFIPFTQSMATTSKTAVAKGMYETVASAFSKNFAELDGQVSNFLSRRWTRRSIDPRAVEKGFNAAFKPFELVDRFASKSIVAGKYHEGLQKGLSKAEAMKQADDYAVKIIADRTVGGTPNIMNTRTLGPMTQFQVEVNNAVSVLTKDVPSMTAGNKAKIASVLAQVAVYSYLFNEVFESVAGYRPTLDPIDAVATALGINEKGKDKPVGKRVVASAEQLRRNLPFISSGGRLPITAGLPNVKAVLEGKAEWGDELKKPAFLLAPPYGGNQLKKTIEGLDTARQGYSETKSGRIRTPVGQTPGNIARGALFGQYSFPEVRSFFDRGDTPLGPKQSEEFKKDGRQVYDRIQKERQEKRQAKASDNVENKNPQFNLKESNARWERDKARAKRENDLDAYLASAEKRYTSLDLYLRTLDPKVDAPEILRIQKKMEDLVAEGQKFVDQGGFTKSKAAKGRKSKGRGKVVKVKSRLIAATKRARVKAPKVTVVRAKKGKAPSAKLTKRTVALSLPKAPKKTGRQVKVRR